MKKSFHFDSTVPQDHILKVDYDDFEQGTDCQPHFRVAGLSGSDIIELEHKMNGSWYPLIINGVPIQLTTVNVYVPVSAPIELKLKKGTTVSSNILVGFYGRGGWHE